MNPDPLPPDVTPATDADVEAYRSILACLPGHDLIWSPPASLLARLDAERRRAERAEAERDAARAYIRDRRYTRVQRDGRSVCVCDGCLENPCAPGCALRASLGEGG